MDSDVHMNITFDDLDKERGLYEPDLLYENDWKFQWHRCKKHPGHHDFIPRNALCLEHLPVHAQHPEFLNFFKCMADLTCRLVVSYISLYRPDQFPFAACRGKNITMVGSGMVSPLYSKIHTDEPCPCRTCKGSAEPRKVWGEVRVHTAAHNVFDSYEAESTRIHLFYDADEDWSAGRIRNLDIVRVDQIDLDRDFCRLLCATHDMELFNRIEDALKSWQDLMVKAWRKYSEMEAIGMWPGGNVCVIPSHPHGSFKRVTIGKVEFAQSDEKTVYTGDSFLYKTCTCPGSSGAPVVCLGEVDRKSLGPSGEAVPVRDGPVNLDGVQVFSLPYPPHRGATRTSSVNKSGVGIW